MMKGRKAVFLVEAGFRSGLGHLRRMQVLANAFRDSGWECSFGVTGSEVCSDLEQSGFNTEIWVGNALNLAPADVLIVDGYKYSSALLDDWRNHCRKLVVMDDMAENPVTADIILNHNIYGGSIDYSKYDFDRLLAGPEYCLVDERFLERDSSVDRRKRVLITFGGTDDGRFSYPVANSLLGERSGIEIDVVISPLQKKTNRFDALLADHGKSIRIHYGADMPSVMASSSVFVGAAGFSLVEAMCSGLLPVVCATADNQLLNVKALNELGYRAYGTYDAELLAETVLEVLSDCVGTQLGSVDGQGAARVRDAIVNELGDNVAVNL